jgi:serine/threonine-protein kinase
MLTGRPVFMDENPFNIRLLVLEGEPTLPTRLNPRIPRDLERICLGCLAKSPADRYGSAAALADDLERFLRGEPVEPPTTTVFQRVRRWGRRQPALVSHLVAVVLVLLILQIKFSISGQDLAYHERVMGVLAGWGVASMIFQALLNRPRTSVAARYLWAVADIVFLTTMLYMADDPLGPLLICYPLVLAAAGLWFSVRLEAVTTVAAIISYTALVMLRPASFGEIHYRVIFAAVLGLIGYIVAYQVYRLRSLSRYFEQ